MSRTYSKELLEEYEEKKFEYNGKKLSEYEALQEQRRIERGIRRWKREQIALKAAELDTSESSAMIKSWQEKEKDFLRQTGLKKDNVRSQVGTYSQAEANKTKAEAEWHYKEWINSISNEGHPKSLAAYYDMKYNNSNEYILLKDYASKVESGMISPLCSFGNYKELHGRIENELVGITTSNGIKIKRQSDHFIERVVGTAKDPTHSDLPRSGVNIEDIEEALKNGKVKAVKHTPNKKTSGKSPSQSFYTEKCLVSVNPDDGVLIQCNPL